jgi:L,D-transpeptidase catalytic domain
MNRSTRCVLALSALAVFLALVFAFNPFSSRSAAALSSWSGQTINWSNVRTGPGTSFRIVSVYAPNTPVTVFASVSGQIVWGGISTWDRISSLTSSPLYIYGPLVAQRSGSGAPPPSAQGKEIIVSLSHQWLWAYDNGKVVFNAAVMTGRPALPTPTGTYHVFLKLHPTTFTSPWPVGSPYWYPPTFINYALEWRAGGFFLHDSWWHSVYGPGTNGWHFDPKFGWQWGTHGCVAMPFSTAQWLYNWAPIGTTVIIKL